MPLYYRYVVLGWIAHYIPFFMMKRTTMLHHYFPALYFTYFSAGFLLDELVREKWIVPNMRNHISAGVISTVIATFWYFRHLTFGMDFPARLYSDRVWLEGWRKLAE